MKKYTITAFMLVLCMAAFGQSFSALKNKKGNNPMLQNGLKVYIRHTSVTSKYTPNYGAPTVNIAWRNDEYKKGAARSRYENPTLGDLLQGIPRGISTVKAIKNDQPVDNTPAKWADHAHGGGLIGWYQRYYNVVAKDRLLVSPGFSMGDYIYGSRYSKTGGNKGDMDPYGYFVAVGPAVMSSYLITNKMWIDGYVNYDIAVAKIQNRGSKDYQKPHFLSIGADLYTGTKVFGGMRLNRMIDRGANKDLSTRLDISIGLGL